MALPDWLRREMTGADQRVGHRLERWRRLVHEGVVEAYHLYRGGPVADPFLRSFEDWPQFRALSLATSQLPIEKWRDIIGDPTLADAILDRLVHNAYNINLKGASMRKYKAPLTRTTQPK